MKTRSIVTSVLLAFLLSMAPAGQAAPEVDPILLEIITDACPADSVEKLTKKLNGVVRRLSKKKNWQLSLRASIYTSCFLRYSTWRTSSIAFNLGHVGIVEGLQPSTIVYLTAMLSRNAMGKSTYVMLGQTWEKLEGTGLEQGYIKDIIATGRKNKYRVHALEGLSYLYLEFRQRGKTHEQALAEAIELGKKIKRSSAPGSIRKRAAGLLSSLNPEGSEPLLFEESYWEQKKGVMVQADSKSFHVGNGAWDAKKLAEFAGKWKSARYRFGGSSRQGIDTAGFVLASIKDQFPNTELPSSAIGMTEFGNNVQPEAYQPGDLLFFSTAADQKAATHVGIYIGDNKFAYASNKGVLVSSFSDSYYRRRFLLAKRLFKAK